MKRLIAILLTSALMLSLLVIPSHAATGWSEAYRDFLLNQKFRSSGQTYHDLEKDGEAIQVSLQDMDGNGIPELILTNGEFAHAYLDSFVYTYSNGAVSYAGNLGNSYVYFVSKDASYPGVYRLFSGDGYYIGYYAVLVNGKVSDTFVVQSVTERIAEQEHYDVIAKTEEGGDFAVTCDTFTGPNGEKGNAELYQQFPSGGTGYTLGEDESLKNSQYMDAWYLNEINSSKWKDFLNDFGYSEKTTEPVAPTPSSSNKTYTVRYNSNGGISDNYPAQTKKAGEPLKLNPSIPIGTGGHEVNIYWNMNRSDNDSSFRTTAIFTGWNTKPDGTGQSYPAGGTYTSDADVTLYAQWASSYTLRLTPLYTNDGKLFDGWYTSLQGGTKITESTPVAANTTLYAHWKTPDPSANSGANGVHFARRATYNKGHFKDVSSSQWYASNVASAYELGLMKGTSNTTFNPSGDVTIAEALTMASRIHSIYTTGSENFVQSGQNWYQVYVDYANQNGIIDDTYNSYYKLGDVTRKATRAEFAMFFAGALPDKGLAAINIIYDNAVPDVGNIACSSAVYKLYRAGILTGSDVKGTFHPTSFITRAEAAAIVDRMAESNDRVIFSLK